MREVDDDQKPGAEADAAASDLARLMRDDSGARTARTASPERNSLADRARAEAQRAVSERDQQQAAATPESEPEPTAAPAAPDRRVPLLQAALGICVVLVALLAWAPWRAAAPVGPAPDTGGQPGGARSGAARPIATGAGASGIQAHPEYQQAMLVALEGDFKLAAQLLERLLNGSEQLEPTVERMLHAQVAYYYRKSGQYASALQHERLGRADSQRAFLASELWDVARAAEHRGDAAEARRAYARFLLQTETMSPSLRALVGEAWLRLGDTYRAEATSGDPGADPDDTAGDGGDER